MGRGNDFVSYALKIPCFYVFGTGQDFGIHTTAQSNISDMWHVERTMIKFVCYLIFVDLSMAKMSSTKLQGRWFMLGHCSISLLFMITTAKQIWVTLARSFRYFNLWHSQAGLRLNQEGWISVTFGLLLKINRSKNVGSNHSQWHTGATFNKHLSLNQAEYKQPLIFCVNQYCSWLSWYNPYLPTENIWLSTIMPLPWRVTSFISWVK